MEPKYESILKTKLGAEAYQKLIKINNSNVHDFIAEYIELCNPASIFVCTDSKEDIQYIRSAAVRNHEEFKSTNEKHTVHFDGYYDQARDKQKTKFLLPKDIDLGPEINSIDRDEALIEIKEIMKNIMAGHEVYVKFF